MNQAQRKFLIDRIEANVKKQIEAIKQSDLEQPPSLENYLYGLALTGKLEIMEQEHIKKVLCERAMKHTARNGYSSGSWLGRDTHASLSRNAEIKVSDLIVIPDDYTKQWDEYRQSENARQEKIRQIQIECDTLVTRIQLASDKTLEKMISEVDDMGDVSLMDTKLKSLIAPHENKMIQ